MKINKRFFISLISISSLRTISSLSLKMTASSTLYDLPVSNNGARCRLILYKKCITADEVKIASPMELGGLKSSDFLKLNPQGKMPVLVTDGMSIPESDTICRFLMSIYADKGPSFLPDDPRSNLIARIHDMYITTIQGCLYKAAPPFGIYGTRSDALHELKKQLNIIEDLVSDDGLYLCGNEVSLADASLFPTMIFVDAMFPKFGINDGVPPKLSKWFHEVREKDADFGKIYEEVHGGLNSWEKNNRWANIYLAGNRDEEPATIFDKLISREIPAAIVKEDDKIFAFKGESNARISHDLFLFDDFHLIYQPYRHNTHTIDINPAAPAHILVIPKDRMGLSNLRKSSPEHIEILGRLLVAAGEIANNKELGFNDGARIIINDGPDGGQEIPHLHVHVLGGKSLSSNIA